MVFVFAVIQRTRNNHCWSGNNGGYDEGTERDYIADLPAFSHTTAVGSYENVAQGDLPDPHAIPHATVVLQSGSCLLHNIDHASM